MTTIHAVPFGSATLTAECGQRLGRNGHTGHYRPLSPIDGATICEKCDPTAAREDAVEVQP